MSGILVYEGECVLNRKPIIMVATTTKNVKTGDMIQTWILNKDIPPLEAIDTYQDSSICGDCKHRGTSCYVRVEFAPSAVFKKYQRGGYQKASDFEFFKDKIVRFGAYGDPTAIPIKIWKSILEVCKGHTSYTHQWKQKRFQSFKEFTMASVDSEKETDEAKKLGWRTFRVKLPEAPIRPKEFVCPASEEAGKRLQCNKCLLCDGVRKSKTRHDIVINAHGFVVKKNHFKKISLTLV